MFGRFFPVRLNHPAGSMSGGSDRTPDVSHVRDEDGSITSSIPKLVTACTVATSTPSKQTQYSAASSVR
jgi:hypothetical protein